MDRYSARINLYGTTKRERELNLLKQSLEREIPTSLSHKNVLINGEPSQLVINTGTQPYYKEFESLPGQIINIGDYVDFANQKWLVTTADVDDEVYIDGKLEQCNWLLKWQNEKGEIIERWAVIMSASKYNDGTKSSPTIVLGSDQLSVVIPVDSESLKLKKSMSKKFFIDNDLDNPTAYELTGTGNVSDTYDGHGITSWIVKECAYSPTSDDLKYGVCNYVSPTTPTEPTTPENPNQSPIRCKIEYKSLKVKIGGSARTYIGSYYDENGNLSNDIGEWIITSDFNNKITTFIDGNTIKISISEDYPELDMETFTLQYRNTHSGFTTSISITIEML